MSFEPSLTCPRAQARQAPQRVFSVLAAPKRLPTGSDRRAADVTARSAVEAMDAASSMISAHDAPLDVVVAMNNDVSARRRSSVRAAAVVAPGIGTHPHHSLSGSILRVPVGRLRVADVACGEGGYWPRRFLFSWATAPAASRLAGQLSRPKLHRVKRGHKPLAATPIWAVRWLANCSAGRVRP